MANSQGLIVIHQNNLRNQTRADADVIAQTLMADPRTVVSGVIMQYDPDTLELIVIREYGNLREVSEWLAQSTAGVK